MSAQQAVAIAPHAPAKGPPRLPGFRRVRDADVAWALAFILPYAAVFLGFVVYPFAYALWIASEPGLFAHLIDDPNYRQAVANTLLFVGIGVNLKMFLALLLSGFFLQPGWWIKALLAVYIVPWTLPAVQACISFHWMLIGPLGLVDGVFEALFGIEGPYWFNDRWLALGSNIVAYIWKWMPFWTVIFLAGRMAIRRDIYDAAEIDGAVGVRRFVYVTFPLLANLYLLCTLLSVLWTFGDFVTTYLVSGGGPIGQTDVLATLGYHYAFDFGRPALGVAAVLSALPVLIPTAIVLMRKFQTGELQL